MPKKTRAVKKTDQKKAWLRKPNVSQYKVDSVEMRKTVLVVCEGQTEKIYFESFPVKSLTVKAVDLGGQSKLKLVESTKSIIENDEYDIIWCVFDMDVKHRAKEFSDFDTAIKNAEALGFNVAYSNDSFELWFYLHYEYTDQQHLRGYYYEKLSEFWNINYEAHGKKWKFCSKIYELLDSDSAASQERAIRFADKLHESQKQLVYHDQNPITLVYKLVEELNSFCK